MVREPDAINWIDDDHFAMANEGDMDGGSRGWSILHQDGTLVYDSGMSFEHALIEIGHYPESRSENKGVEPESIGFGIFDGTPWSSSVPSAPAPLASTTSPIRRPRRAAPDPALGHRAGGLRRSAQAQPADLRERGRPRRGRRSPRGCHDLPVHRERGSVPDADLRRGHPSQQPARGSPGPSTSHATTNPR